MRRTNPKRLLPSFLRSCFPAGKIIRQTLAIAALLCLSHTLQAQISVTANNNPPDPFSALPPATSWSRFSIAGAGGDVESNDALDARVQQVAASSINTQLESNTGNPPGTSANGRWSSVGLYLATRPTGNLATLIMATLRNDASSNLTGINIIYDYAQMLTTATADEVLGAHRVYYSFTGATDSWVPLGTFGARTPFSTAQPITISANFSATPWTAGSLLYIVFADDNAASVTDYANTIDNFKVEPAGPPRAVTILQQPTGTNAVEAQRVTLSVTADGTTPITYQWLKDGTAITGANSATFIIASMLPSDAGSYTVQAGNAVTPAPGYVTSSPAVVTYTAVPPVITNDVADASVLQGRNVTLRVGVSGPNLKYQWYHNDAEVTGATASSLAITNAQTADGGPYYVVVTNLSGVVTSRVATVTYTADTFAPIPQLAVFNPAGNRVTVTFDEPLSTVPEDVDQFNINVFKTSNGEPLTVLAAYVTNVNQVVIDTDTRDASAEYSVTFTTTVKDVYGNIVTEATIKVLPEIVFQQGVNGYAGTQDTELRGGNGQNATPQGTRADFINIDNSDGTPAAPSHGLIRFDNIVGTAPGQIPPGAVIRSATLRLSSTGTSANGDQVNMYRMLTDWNQATATWDSLNAGVANDGTEASTNADATWATGTLSIPFVTTLNNSNIVATLQAWVNGTAANFGWAILPTGGDGYRIDPSEHVTEANRPLLTVVYELISGQPVSITQQPTSQTIAEGSPLTLSVGVTGSSPITFQWFRNGSPIAGATNNTYTVASAHPLANNGSYFVTAQNSVNTTNSATVTVTVTPDTTAPTVVSVNGGLVGSTTIVVTFSEPVDPTSAQNTANYQLQGPGGLTITSAVLGADGKTVTLTLSGARSNANYSLVVSGVKDLAETPNTTATTTVAVSQKLELIGINTTSWKYLQQTVDGAPAPCLDGETWTAPGYNDSAWQSGTGVFYGVRSGTNLPITLNGSTVNTLLNVFTNATPANALQETNYYFRTTFNFPACTNGATLLLHAMVDDGAVFYLNGQRLHSMRLTNNPVYCTNLANAAGGQTWEPALSAAGTNIVLTGLVKGTNTLAVEVHQNSTTSSDITLGVLLEAIPSTFEGCDNVLPGSLTIRQSSNGTITLSWTGGGTLVESATVDGTYTASANQNNPQTIAATGTSKFYRLRQ
jgi:hypothetical protein